MVKGTVDVIKESQKSVDNEKGGKRKRTTEDDDEDDDCESWKVGKRLGSTIELDSLSPDETDALMRRLVKARDLAAEKRRKRDESGDYDDSEDVWGRKRRRCGSDNEQEDRGEVFNVAVR